MRTVSIFTGFNLRRLRKNRPFSLAPLAAKAIGVALLLLVTTAWSESAFAEDNVTRMGDRVNLTCNGHFSPIQLLCKDGGACGRLDTADPEFNPAQSSASPQDNIFFSNVPTNVMWEVRRVATTVTLPGMQGMVTSDSPVRTTIAGPDTDPDTPIDITVVTPNWTPINQPNVNSSPVQIKIEALQGQDFVLLQYRVKCSESEPPPDDTARITIKKVSIGGDGDFVVNVVSHDPPPMFDEDLDLPTEDGMATKVIDVPIRSGGDSRYDVTETDDDGFNLESIVCEITKQTTPPSQPVTTSSGVLRLREGAEALCTVTNKRPSATIKIKKEQSNDAQDPNDPRFNIQLDGNTVTPAPPDSGPEGLLVGQMTAEIIVDADNGSATVSEPNLPPNWTIDGIDCGRFGDTSGNSLEVDVKDGDEVECTVTNTFTPPDGKVQIRVLH